MAQTDALWICPECDGRFYHNYGNGPCPHCKDPITKERRNVDHPQWPTYAYIQWKGTDACMDVHCKCGAQLHIDSDFLYFMQCPYCNTVYMTATYVSLYELGPTSKAHEEALKSPSLHLLDKREDDYE